jgi:hypothetical protein
MGERGGGASHPAMHCVHPHSIRTKVCMWALHCLFHLPLSVSRHFSTENL